MRRAKIISDTKDDMRTALRQPAAITALDHQPLMRQSLELAHWHQDAMLRLEPDERSRRISLIDAMFPPSALRRSAP
jgi:hypothetical protein